MRFPGELPGSGDDWNEESLDPPGVGHSLRDALSSASPEEQLRVITRIVRSLVSSEVDYENLGAEIWKECYERGLPISYTLIQHRVLAHCRRLRFEQQFQRRQQPEESSDPPDGEPAIVDILMVRAELSPSERLLIFETFYLGHSTREIALGHKTSRHKVARALRLALSKLRHAGRSLT